MEHLYLFSQKRSTRFAQCFPKVSDAITYSHTHHRTSSLILIISTVEDISSISKSIGFNVGECLGYSLGFFLFDKFTVQEDAIFLTLFEGVDILTAGDILSPIGVLASQFILGIQGNKGPLCVWV
jgi:hypothetical protein